jgi:hypothetical protein
LYASIISGIAPDFEVYDIKYWSGSQWIDIAGRLFELSNWGLSFSAAPDGTLFIAETGTGSAKYISVYKWDWINWQNMSFGLDGVYAGVYPQVVTSFAGNPFVSWLSGDDLYLKYWSGSQWLPLGGSTSGDGVSQTGAVTGHSIALTPDGRPCLLWSDDSYLPGSPEIYIRCWDTTTSSWVEVGGASASLGGISDNPTPSVSPQIAIAPDGAIYAVWIDGDPGRVYVKRWTP